MSKRNPGGLISNTGLRKPSATDQSQNSGVWTLEEQYLADSKGTWANQSGQSYEIGNSLRFRASATAYLTRTPTVVGNRTTWTWSGWVKRSASTRNTLFGFGTSAAGGSSGGACYIESTGSLHVIGGGGVACFVNTSTLYRDPSAWYHVVIAFDTRQVTASDRVKIYVNGSQVTALSTTTYPSQNYSSDYNNTIAQYIGVRGDGGLDSYFDGYLTEINSVDGQQLDPSYFGYFDYNGVWQPKKYIGGYGTNGFYLPLTAGSSYSYYTPESASVSAAANAGFSFTGDFTLEGWMYGLTTGDRSMFVMYDGSTYFALNAQVNNGYDVYTNSPGATLQIRSHAPSLREWTHVAMVRSGGVIRVYTNGVASASTLSNSSTLGYTNQLFYIGGLSSNSSGSQNAFFSNVRVSNVARYTSTFDANAVKVLNSDANTVLLTAKGSTFADVGPNNLTVSAVGASNIQRFSHISSTPGQDESGNNNDYVLNNFSFVDGPNQDGMRDSPTNGSTVEDTGLGGQLAGNYATLNPLENVNATYLGFQNGNLRASMGTGAGTMCWANMVMPTDKWYWEVTISTVGNGASVGISYGSNTTTDGNAKSITYSFPGGKRVLTVDTSYGASYTTGDIIGVAVDKVASTITFYKNNVSQGAITESTIASQDYRPFLHNNSSSGSAFLDINFGQRPFAYAAPAGFKCLNTVNLPTPTIPDGKDHFDVVRYSGNNSTQSVFVGFQPDFVWSKCRNVGRSHRLSDSVRGSFRDMYADAADIEYSNGSITAFTPTGFDLTNATASTYNTSGENYVSWVWKVGSTTVTNTSGSITSQVRANPAAGFSVVTYTGTATTGTVGHGLGVAPKMIIVKSRSLSGSDWDVYHANAGNTGRLYLNQTAAFQTIDVWNNTTPTSTVFTINGARTNVNGNGATYVAYCFSEVAGYSKLGGYTGNGSADGIFVYTGFRPRFVLFKRTDSTGDWHIYDTSRDDYNVLNKELTAASGAETTAGGARFDYLANGFKARGTGAALNASGGTYIYMAFAEHPFKTARAR